MGVEQSLTDLTRRFKSLKAPSARAKTSAGKGSRARA
jgi:hypothetical protein